MDIIIQHFKEKITSEIKKELDKVFLEGQGNITELIDLVDTNLKDLGSADLAVKPVKLSRQTEVPPLN